MERQDKRTSLLLYYMDKHVLFKLDKKHTYIELVPTHKQKELTEFEYWLYTQGFSEKLDAQKSNIIH